MGVDGVLQDFWFLEYDKPDFVEPLQPFINHDSLSGRQDSSVDTGKLDCEAPLP
jgi:hypothetical protein